MMYLIQGVFFQEREGLRIVCRPIEGNVAVIQRGLGRFSFSGVISTDPRHVLGGLTGEVRDSFGIATLSDVVIFDDQVEFTKQYQERALGGPIKYIFRNKIGNTWIGEYSSPTAGNGVARCVITQVDDDFFDPDLIVSLLGRGEAFVPPLNPDPWKDFP